MKKPRTADHHAWSGTLPPAANTRLAHGIGRESSPHAAGESGFHLLHEGLSAFAARAELIGEAAVSLDLQYYIYSDDASGRLLTARLLEAADRGVRVRLLVDDLGTRLTNPWVTTLDSHPNMEVRLFNPVEGRSGLRRGLEQALNLGRINHRMHNKLLIVDGLAMIAGGRNIADGYFTSAEVEFLDVDVIAIGAVIAAASITFDDYWNHSVSRPVAELTVTGEDAHSLEELRTRLNKYLAREKKSEFCEALRKSTLAKELAVGRVPFEWGTANLYADPPAKATDCESVPPSEYPGYQLEQVMKSSRQRLQIANAYLIPGRRGTRLFAELEKNGVQVDILTNGLGTNDTAVAHGAYSRYRKPMLRAGVRLWELRPTTEREHRMHWFRDKSRATLHAKAAVIDREKSFVGSINFDSRSFTLNTEIGVLIENMAINHQLHQLFESWVAPDAAWHLQLSGDGKIEWHATDDNNKAIVKHVDPDSTLWQRLLSRLLSRFPIESQI